MAAITLNSFSLQPIGHAPDQRALQHILRVLRVLGVLALAAVLFGLEPAIAQGIGGSGTSSGLCTFAGWMKGIATTAAIIAILLLVLNSFFSKSGLVGDIINTVIIGCVVIASAPFIVGLTGLTSNCSI